MISGFIKALPVLLLVHSTVIGGPYYRIFFKDKQNSCYEGNAPVSAHTQANRALLGLPVFQLTDLPVSPDYSSALAQLHIRPVFASKWLNYVTASLTPTQLAAVKQLPFVAGTQKVTGHSQPAFCDTIKTPEMYGPAPAQMQAYSFIEAGITGKGVTIGVIDAGFYEANTTPALACIFSRGAIKGINDLLIPDRTEHFATKETPSDYHGTEVLKMIAGYDTTDATLYGMAPEADFYLARTDHGIHEGRSEEDNWIAAMEWMDSLGVRLINTSLGYATGMDNPEENYTPEQIDGTSKIATAANMAVQEKGICIVVSAGNEGGKQAWRIISTPADAPGVISVGAVDDVYRHKMNYSSIGPEALPYLKPEVSCYSLTGTSFSAPAITGFAACLLQKDSTLSPRQIKDLLMRSGHLYPYGNNYVGYGVPSAERALELMDGRDQQFGNRFFTQAEGTVIKINMNDKKFNRTLTAFRKKDETTVIKQELLKVKRGKLKLTRLPGEKFTTLSFDDTVMEYEWK